MKYCLRCGKSFTRSFNFERHLNRKKYCKSNILDISYADIKLNYNELLKLAKTVDPDNYLGLEIDTNIPKKEFKCEFCNKIFKHKNNMYRHQKHRCKKKNNYILADKSGEISKKISKLITEAIVDPINDPDSEYIIIKKSVLSSKLAQLSSE